CRGAARPNRSSVCDRLLPVSSPTPMKHSPIASLALLVACQAGVSTPAPLSPIGADITFLARPALSGREAGSPGADSAAACSARRSEPLGLRAAFHRRCEAGPCPESFFQPFSVTRGGSQNVGAIIDGSDSTLRTQFIVVGAHYDHLGRSPTLSLDREKG